MLTHFNFFQGHCELLWKFPGLLQDRAVSRCEPGGYLVDRIAAGLPAHLHLRPHGAGIRCGLLQGADRDGHGTNGFRYPDGQLLLAVLAAALCPGPVHGTGSWLSVRPRSSHPQHVL